MPRRPDVRAGAPSRRRVLWAALLMFWGIPSAASAQMGQAAALFETHCASCHRQEALDRAPSRDALRERTPEQIVSALTDGVMRTVAPTLTSDQKRIVAEYLTGRPVGAAGTQTAMSGRCSADVKSKAGHSWNGWGGDVSNGRFQRGPEAGLPTAAVPTLSLKWAFGFPNGRSAFGQPTVVGGRVYVGSDTGFVHALDTATGCLHWSFEASAGVRTAVSIGPVGDGRQAAFFGDLKANVYAIDIRDGALIWRQRVDTHPVARITGAPTFYEGRLFVPVSSLEESVGSTPSYECCTFRGSVVALEARTGREVWKHYVIDAEPVRTRRTSVGTQLWGPAGGAVWSAPTVDAARRLLYVSTSNGYTYPAPNTTDAILALALDTGRRVWISQQTADDAWIVGCSPPRSENCPEVLGPDFSIGASSILRKGSNGRDVLIVGYKSGLVRGLDPGRKGARLWEVRIGKGSTIGGIEWGGAADDGTAYFANSDERYGPQEAGGLAAIDFVTGEQRWFTRPTAQSCTNAGRPCTPAQSAAVTVIPGVVFSGTTDGVMRAYHTKDGTVLWEFDTKRDYTTVNGVPARGGSLNGPGPTIVDGMVFFNSGYAHLGGGIPGNVLLAFGPK